MTNELFQALVLEQRDGATVAEIRSLAADALPAGDVLVDVAFSSLNYKDGLAITGRGKVIRQFPMVPGIDFAGTVAESQHPGFQPGDAVVLTGWGVGERHWGGLAQRARVRGDWLVPLPDGLDTRAAMAIGTAGFTAMLSVLALEAHGLAPGRDLLVTGAAGGVGSVAVALLARAGHRVVASSGRADAADYLRSLGAAEVIGRLPAEGRPLESERWGGVVDTVGGATLAAALRATAYGGSVAACGNAGGADLNTTVFPFILRGVNLLGIESVMFPAERRPAAWARLARDLPADLLERMIHDATLRDVPALAAAILDGQVRGRVVVNVGT
ncbi:MDR family oxidoreductase [Kouleothrix sp.]|uniref:acrylyl-CoA reductase (NADPH) n=1 Tax=Kouleothrix sp. TaxID=2779161 RepID=UPI00391C67BB